MYAFTLYFTIKYTLLQSKISHLSTIRKTTPSETNEQTNKKIPKAQITSEIKISWKNLRS